ncbi:AraC family transcriptional regulator [Lachnospiraceae bacterium OttesenSCG-928-D06]|nr:AraC family transcriptional regulator [Lachnospiraceae bacterium OttesenSCG-928-D06]
MESTLFDVLEDKVLHKYLEQQHQIAVKRIVESNYETVIYPPGSSIRFWLNDESTNYALHWHPALEIIMPLENIYTVTVRQKEYVLNPGDIFIIPAGELHILTAPPTGTRLIYLFDFSILSKIRGFAYLTPYLSNPVLMNKDNYGEIYDAQAKAMIDMCNAYFADDSLRELTVYSLLLNFFVTFGKYRINQEESTPYTTASAGKQKDLLERLNKVFDHLDEHYMEEITLEMAAGIAGFSKFHFSRMFKQSSGYSFYDYLCYRRIKSAEFLLLKPELSITEIALQSGFTSLSTFNRTFKRFKNCTPSEYRKLYDSSIHY